MAYPNYGYNSYGYVPNYAPGYVQPQYATNPYQNMQQPQQAQVEAGAEAVGEIMEKHYL